MNEVCLNAVKFVPTRLDEPHPIYANKIVTPDGNTVMMWHEMRPQTGNIAHWSILSQPEIGDPIPMETIWIASIEWRISANSESYWMRVEAPTEKLLVRYADIAIIRINTYCEYMRDEAEPNSGEYKEQRTDWPESQHSEYMNVKKRLSPNDFRDMYLNKWIPPEE